MQTIRLTKRGGIGYGWVAGPLVVLTLLSSPPCLASEGEEPAAPASTAVTESGPESAPAVAPAAAPAVAPPLAPPSNPEAANPCAGITCSGRGRCVTTPQGPTCACELGFRADPTNGLSCLRMGTPGYSAEPLPVESGEQMVYIERLVSRDLSGHYADYQALAGTGDADDFANFYYTRQRHLRTGMALMTLLGTALFWSGGSAALNIGDDNDPLTRSRSEVIGSVVGGVCIAAGTVTLIAGAVTWARTAKVLRRLKPVMDEASENGGHSRTSFLGLAPFASLKGDAGGLAASFAF